MKKFVSILLLLVTSIVCFAQEEANDSIQPKSVIRDGVSTISNDRH